MQATRRFFIISTMVSAIGSLLGASSVFAAPPMEPQIGREPSRKSPDRRPPEKQKKSEKKHHPEERRDRHERKEPKRNDRREPSRDHF